MSTSRAPTAGTPRRRTVEDEYGHLGYDDDDSDDYVRIPRSHPPPVRRGDAIETLFTVRKKNGKMSKAKQRLLLVSTPRGEEIRGKFEQQTTLPLCRMAKTDLSRCSILASVQC